MSKPKPRSWWPTACVVAAVLAASARAAEDKPKEDAGKDRRDIEYVEPAPEDEPTKPPIERRVEPAPPDSVAGHLLLSNGDRVDGHVHLTRDAALKFTDPDRKKLLRIRLDELTHIEQKVITERMEKEWRWLENANDRKVYTGREYPMRELQTVLHLKTGRTLEGPMTALLFVTNENGRQRFVLHKRQKGKPGEKLSDLLYVKLVDFRPPEKEAPPAKDAPAKDPR
ncbi:MAG TPA: hypothetical protein VMZ92_00225 [Planctomycetota bacterium]|nr:hypothetical protein [Planctomycetota bacterium]